MKKTKPQKETYQAFNPVDKNKRLQIRQTNGTYHAPAYSYLLDVISDGNKGEEIILVYSFMLVKIKGKHLQTLLIAIEKSECAFIQNYDESVFNPPEENQPIIEFIEVITRERES